jgi:hypothetical protein
MTAAIGAAGAAFIGAFMWREVLIGWAALRWGTDMPVSRRALLSGYYAAVTGTGATRAVLGVVSVVALSALGVQAFGTLVWPPLVCAACLTVVLAMSSAQTWPAAKRLGARVVPACGEQQRATRALTASQLAYVALMSIVVGIQLATAQHHDLSPIIAATGAAFLAGTLWNEVLVDRSVSRGSQGSMTASSRSTMLGYYAVMTVVAARPNLAAVFLSIIVTAAALIAQVSGGVADPGAVLSLALFTVFLALASLRTWPAAARLGSNTLDYSQHSAASRMLGRFHLLFVIILLCIVTLQFFVLA